MPSGLRTRPTRQRRSPRTRPGRRASTCSPRAAAFPEKGYAARAAVTEKRSLLRHLTVLRDEAEQQPVPNRKFFAIGNPSHIEGYGETLPLLSWVEESLSRFVISNAPSTSWGRVTPAPFVYALPNIAVKPKDGIFLVTGPGE